MAAFRLQALLDYRHQLEERQMVRLGAVEAERGAAQDLLEELHLRREEQCRRLDQLGQAQSLDAYRMREAVAHLGLIEAAIARQREALQEVEARVDAQRDRLMEAVRDRRVLERLRDRQAAAARLESDRVEARRADEIVTGRFGRSDAESVGKGV